MSSRRQFIAGMALLGLAPQPLWADVGGPSHLAAGKRPNGHFVLCGLDASGRMLFELPLPERGHAAAAHPFRPEAVAFARRPGTFALVIDCRDGGAVTAQLEAPHARHFFGHGVFSSNGTVLYTSENAYDTGEGRIGIWDAQAGYKRIGEFSSGGIGPHELLRLPGAETLVIANGGIETHPATGRTKLNLGFMEPNLSYLDPDGKVLEQVRLDPSWHMHSIRHLAVRYDGTVAAACQWQGDVIKSPPLLFLHRMGEDPQLLEADQTRHNQMNAYAGSVAFSGDGRLVAISGPRGGQVQFFNADTGVFVKALELEDACGVASQGDGVFVTTGTGAVGTFENQSFTQHSIQQIQWDNHLIALT